MLIVGGILALLVYVGGGYFALRWAWREGYCDGVAAMQLTLEDALKKRSGKERGNG